MDGDRERWNAKWRERAGELEDPNRFLVAHADILPTRGKALDVAGGAGRNAVWLARRGMDVTLVDVSDVALEKAERRVRALGIDKHLRVLHADLEKDLPLAPLFDLVVIIDYLDRTRRDNFVSLLVDGGFVIAIQATKTNLDRHAHPSERYLVEPGELEAWARKLGLEVVVAREGWTDEGRHEAAIIAERRPRVVEVDPLREDSGPTQGPYR